MPQHTLSEIGAVVFIDIAVIITVARLMGMLFRRLRQPAVVGEILAGIALGPSLLGSLPGDPSTFLFPTYVRPFLNVVAQLGLIIFMFIVGLELDVALIRGKERAAATISLASVLLPFALGIGLAAVLHGEHGVVGGEQVDFLPFALFIGASMSVTAFPVLARILTERGMHRTDIGALTLACAAVDDILAWSILAVVLAVVASTGALGLPLILAESAAFIAFMFLAVRPALRYLVRAYERAGHLTPNVLAVILVGFLTSAFLTEEIGIHAIFGAFLFGVAVPREGTRQLFGDILDKLEQVSVLLLLPVFFIATGLNVDVRGLGGTGFLELLAVMAVAVSGKFLGAAGAARALHLGNRKAGAIGVLMNTRGLTELVILNVGLSVGVLDPSLFTILVLMAVLTTVMTEPLLRLVYPDKLLRRDIAEAEKASLGLIDAYRVLALVALEGAEATVDTGVLLLGRDEPSELVLTRFDRPVRAVEVGSGLGGELLAIAEAFGASQSLVRRATSQGASAVARSQFSDDPSRDLLRQAEAVEADVVLVGVGPEAPGLPDALALVDRLVASSEAVVVLRVAPAPAPPAAVLPANGEPHSVVALPGPGDDGLAAVEQAFRIALRLGVPLVLLEGGHRREARRLDELAARLTAAGVPSSTRHAPDDLPTGLREDTVLVAGLSGWCAGRPASTAAAALVARAAGTVLLVRARPDDRGEQLAKLLQDVTATHVPATPDQRVPSPARERLLPS
ncbi:MAG: cation/H(+) antiporter [Frankiales bacterium]|nr:cation/H(+) antiporter [Frankiales bacterium]